MRTTGLRGSARFSTSMLALVASSSWSCEAERRSGTPSCGPLDLAVEVVAAPLASDGSALVSGRVRFAPPAIVSTAGNTGVGGGAEGGGSPAVPELWFLNPTDGGVDSERTVHDVYVADTRVTRADFNFRAFSVVITRNQLCSHRSADGSTAALPVRVYVAGNDQVCVHDALEALTVDIDPTRCEDEGGGGGDAAGEGGAAATTGSTTGGGGGDGGASATTSTTSAGGDEGGGGADPSTTASAGGEGGA